jgi:hypothetical protein
MKNSLTFEDEMKTLLNILILSATVSVSGSVFSKSLKVSKKVFNKNTEVFLADKRSENIHILVNGGMHGNETLSPDFVLWLKDRVLKGKSTLSTLTFDYSLDFLPVMNKSGFERKNRYNARGVNLNRNFPVLWGISRENPGIAPASEPETKLVMKLFKDRKYDVAIDVHGYVNWIVGPTSPALMELYTGKKVSKLKKNIHADWQKAMNKNISFLKGYELRTAGGLGDGGAFEDYAFWQENAKTFCLEIHSRAKDPKFKAKEYLSYETYIKNMIIKAHQMKNGTSVAGK